jgi:hypothetical protein
MKLLTKAELPKAIESITKRGKVLDTDIHIAACSAVAIKAEAGDTMFINRLYTALPKGTRAAALTAWLLKFGGVIANDGSSGKPKAEQPFLHTKDKACDVTAGMAEPWYDFKPDPKPDEVYDIMAAVMQIIKKAKGKEVVHGELLSTLASIVETGALSSNTGSGEANPSLSEKSDDSDPEDSSPESESLLPTHGTDGRALVDLAKGLIGGEPAAAMSH